VRGCLGRPAVSPPNHLFLSSVSHAGGNTARWAPTGRNTARWARAGEDADRRVHSASSKIATIHHGGRSGSPPRASASSPSPLKAARGSTREWRRDAQLGDAGSDGKHRHHRRSFYIVGPPLSLFSPQMKQSSSGSQVVAAHYSVHRSGCDNPRQYQVLSYHPP
jgi:hypothetical protein